MDLEQLITNATKMKSKYGNLGVKLHVDGKLLDADIVLAENSLGEIIAEIDYGTGLKFDQELNDEE